MVDERKKQKKYLLRRWQCMERKEVLEDKFYIISFQSYFEFPEEEGYQPCELAVVEFSLKHGISREFHAMIDSGPIKRGLGAEAKLYSEKYHKIPTYGFELGRQDHFALWDELLDFVNSEQKREFPPLFSRLSEHRKNVACLEYLAGLVRKSNRLSKVFIWEHLALSLYDYAGVTKVPSLNVIEDGCNSSMYDFEPNTKCDYHEELECVHCSMLNVKKCCFWISDAFAEILDYDITEKHLPARREPQYSVIDSDDIIFNPNMKRRFLGADNMPAYDSNLPLGLQRRPIREVLADETSVDEDGIYESRDIRYRKKSFKQPNIGAGRGMVFASYGNAVSGQCNETQSVAETMDDVASAILEDDDADFSIMADDEGSVGMGAGINRTPSLHSVTIQHKLPSDVTSTYPLSLPERIRQMRLKDGVEGNEERSLADSLDDYVSDCSSVADVTQRQPPIFEGFQQVFKQKPSIGGNLAAGDAAGITSSSASLAPNDKRKLFDRSKVGVFAPARKLVISDAPLCFGRGRLLQKKQTVDSSSTYQSDSD